MIIIACIGAQDDNGLVCYRPAVNGNATNIYYVSTKQKRIGYEAKSVDQFVIDEWNKEGDGTTITPYALVDMETAAMYGIKVHRSLTYTVVKGLMKIPCR